MDIKMKIRNIGDSKGVIIPKTVLQSLKLKEGNTIIVNTNDIRGEDKTMEVKNENDN